MTRHNPVIRGIDRYAPLSVGNGEFAFTADITGLQTFAAEYSNAIPLCTMSQWGWHTTPVSQECKSYDIKELKLKQYDTYGRLVGYPTCSQGQEKEYNWLRMNPHRFHLGQIGFELTKANGEIISLNDLNNCEQKLDLWRGILTSRFSCPDQEVRTTTCCHPKEDILAVSVSSQLISTQRLQIKIAFPYGSGGITAADWSSDAKHTTELLEQGASGATLLRIMDDVRYFVHIAWSEGASFTRKGPNSFKLSGTGDSHTLQLVCAFLPYPPRTNLPTFPNIIKACEVHWEEFWQTGGTVELAESQDKRAFELERRVVLSQYLTAIQCSGSVPPQETGLTCNSWYGKHHLEMHFWHAAHFPLWGRTDLLKRSMWWYKSIISLARQTAQSQGYSGARWPKMVGFDGHESPSPIGPLLIWQQPHIIYFAELAYRAQPSITTLEIFKDLVMDTAQFMASYARYDSKSDRYVLGPPLIPAQENHLPEEALNPTFELEYWAFGLKLANQWRARLGMMPEQKWGEVVAKLAPLPLNNGVYLAHEKCPCTFRDYNYDHPSLVAALGVLPGHLVDKKVMSHTLDLIEKEWQFAEMWGWDFPMLAMTAARLNRPKLAIALLMNDSPKNTYLPNGHNRQADRKDLPLYLPGNGSLLMAIAMLTEGWDGCDEKTPGFPKNGKWTVRHEGLLPLP